MPSETNFHPGTTDHGTCQVSKGKYKKITQKYFRNFCEIRRKGDILQTL